MTRIKLNECYTLVIDVKGRVSIEFIWNSKIIEGKSILSVDAIDNPTEIIELFNLTLEDRSRCGLVVGERLSFLLPGSTTFLRLADILQERILLKKLED